MVFLLAIILAGIGIAFFALQNPQTVTLNVGPNQLTNIPLYVVIIGTLFFGILLSWIISISKGLFTSLSLHKKDSQIKHAESDKTELTKQVHKLSLENEHLKGKDTASDRSL